MRRKSQIPHDARETRWRVSLLCSVLLGLCASYLLWQAFEETRSGLRRPPDRSNDGRVYDFSHLKTVRSPVPRDAPAALRLLAPDRESILSSEQEQMVDFEYENLSLYQGGEVQAEEIQALRLTQIQPLLLALYAYEEMSRAEMDTLQNELVDFTQKQVREFSEIGASFTHEGKTYRILASSEITRRLRPRDWIAAFLTEAGDGPEIDLLRRFHAEFSENAFANAANGFTEAQYRAFRFYKFFGSQ